MTTSTRISLETIVDTLDAFCRLPIYNKFTGNPGTIIWVERNWNDPKRRVAWIDVQSCGVKFMVTRDFFDTWEVAGGYSEQTHE